MKDIKCVWPNRSFYSGVELEILNPKLEKSKTVQDSSYIEVVLIRESVVNHCFH